MSGGRTVTITQALREDLLDAIQQVKLGKMKAADALAIASLSSQVIASAKLELEVAKFRMIRDAAASSGGHSLNGNGAGKAEEMDLARVPVVVAQSVSSETIPATIRDRSLAQAREMLRARITSGESASPGSELELSVANDYGLSPKAVQALVKEIQRS